VALAKVQLALEETPVVDKPAQVLVAQPALLAAVMQAVAAAAQILPGLV
jgi:hypothetical protein